MCVRAREWLRTFNFAIWYREPSQQTTRRSNERAESVQKEFAWKLRFLSTMSADAITWEMCAIWSLKNHFII